MHLPSLAVARTPAGGCSGADSCCQETSWAHLCSTTLPNADCVDNGSPTALLVGTVTHQESLLSLFLWQAEMHSPSAPQGSMGDISLGSGQCWNAQPGQGIRIPAPISACHSCHCPLLEEGDTELEVGEGGAAPAGGQGGTAVCCEHHPRLGGVAQPSPLAAGVEQLIRQPQPPTITC